MTIIAQHKTRYDPRMTHPRDSGSGLKARREAIPSRIVAGAGTQVVAKAACLAELHMPCGLERLELASSLSLPETRAEPGDFFPPCCTFLSLPDCEESCGETLPRRFKMNNRTLSGRRICYPERC
jgi:hypothetical protein